MIFTYRLFTDISSKFFPGLESGLAAVAKQKAGRSGGPVHVPVNL